MTRGQDHNRFSLVERWTDGDNSKWEIGGYVLNTAEAVELSGPPAKRAGAGAVFPWGLKRYGRAMRLRPAELWLLVDLLTQVWCKDGRASLSMRKAADEMLASRRTILALLHRLEAKGYIVREPGSKRGGILHFRVGLTYVALGSLVAYDPDPTTWWSQVKGWHPTRDDVRVLWAKAGIRAQPDFDCIDRLAARRRRGRPRRPREDETDFEEGEESALLPVPDCR